MRTRLTEDRRNHQPLGPESDVFSMEKLVSSLKVGKAGWTSSPIPEELGGGVQELYVGYLQQVLEGRGSPTILEGCSNCSHPQDGKPQGQLESYRPIAFMSCLAKVMERMVAKRLQNLAKSRGMLNSDQSGFRPQWSTEDQVIRLSQAISDGFQAKKPPKRTVFALLNFSKKYNKVWWADLLATMLKKGVPVHYVWWIQGFSSNRQARVRLNRAYSRSWVMHEGVPLGSVLALLLLLFVINDLQDCLPRGVHSSSFVDDSALWVHSPKKEDAVPVFQEGVREVYQWARAKKLTLNLKKCKVSFFAADPHEAKWQPVVEVEGTQLAFNPSPLFLGVELGRTLSGKEQADKKAVSLTTGSWMLTALSGSD
jgi:hypothetical protein